MQVEVSSWAPCLHVFGESLVGVISHEHRERYTPSRAERLSALQRANVGSKSPKFRYHGTSKFFKPRLLAKPPPIQSPRSPACAHNPLSTCDRSQPQSPVEVSLRSSLTVICRPSSCLSLAMPPTAWRAFRGTAMLFTSRPIDSLTPRTGASVCSARPFVSCRGPSCVAVEEEVTQGGVPWVRVRGATHVADSRVN